MKLKHTVPLCWVIKTHNVCWMDMDDKPDQYRGRSFWSWWRHQMETSSVLLALCEGNPPVTGELPSQWTVTWSFDFSFDRRLMNRLRNTGDAGDLRLSLSRSLWRQCNDNRHISVRSWQDDQQLLNFTYFGLQVISWSPSCSFITAAFW